jgi:hypothetical protein
MRVVKIPMESSFPVSEFLELSYKADQDSSWTGTG